jgi:putative transposase
VPHVPTSHPFIERLIGTVRRELLDKAFFWNAYDLQNKLDEFQCYYNQSRGRCGIDGALPLEKLIDGPTNTISLENYQWKKHCRGLFQLPMAA